MRATAIYTSDHLELVFEGNYDEYEEGAEITDIKCVGVMLFGEPFNITSLSKTALETIYEIGYELEFEKIESSDADDQGEDE